MSKQKSRPKTQDPSKQNLPQEPNIKKKFHLKDLIQYQPIGKNQKRLFETWRDYPELHLVLQGFPGTGKTFTAMFLALEELLLQDSNYDEIIIIRSVVPTRDIGFLPGSAEEKISQFEEPYISICDELFSFKNSYQNLKELGKIKFCSSSYLRGVTFDNAIIIVDEMQNCTFAELHTIQSRIGKNSRIVFCGDTQQKDIGEGTTKYREISGIEKFTSIIEKLRYKYFDIIEFSIDDCVRSDIVKQYLIAKEDYESSEEYSKKDLLLS